MVIFTNLNCFVMLVNGFFSSSMSFYLTAIFIKTITLKILVRGRNSLHASLDILYKSMKLLSSQVTKTGFLFRKLEQFFLVSSFLNKKNDLLNEMEHFGFEQTNQELIAKLHNICIVSRKEFHFQFFRQIACFG